MRTLAGTCITLSRYSYDAIASTLAQLQPTLEHGAADSGANYVDSILPIDRSSMEREAPDVLSLPLLQLKPNRGKHSHAVLSLP